MKKLKLFILLLAFPALALGAANDLLLNQRNATDSSTLTRLVSPPPGVPGIMGSRSSDMLPLFYTLGPGLTLTGTVLDAAAAAPPSWSVITGKPTTLAGYGITDGVTEVGLASLLTGYATNASVNSGLATKFNNPGGTIGQYIRGDGSLVNFPALSSGTVTSIAAGSGLTGGTITTTGTISMPNVGSAGTYANVTTDAQGRVTGGTNISQSAATRALNTAFQVSATRAALVTYSVQITVTASIAGGQNGDVVLEIASDSGFTSNVQTLSVAGVGQTYTLAIALQGVQPQTTPVSGVVPAGYFVRLRTVNNTGSPSFSYRTGQETLL